MISFWFSFIVIFINVANCGEVREMWNSVSGPLKITVDRTTSDFKMKNKNMDLRENQSSGEPMMNSSHFKNVDATNSSDDHLLTGVGNLLCNMIKLMMTSQSSKLNDSSEMRPRGKQGKHSKITGTVTAAIVSGGFMTLITLAVLSAMAGKALVASLLALGLSALSLWQNGIGTNNNFNQPNTFEIITKPVYKHPSHQSQQDYYYEPPQ